MSVRKRDGRIRREVNVPLCAACAAELNRQSGDEERLQKIRRLAAVVTGLAVIIFVLLVTAVGMGFVLRLLLALPLAALAAFLMIRAFQPAIKNAALPEKKAIRAAAQIDLFSWRATTFLFANETFAERFEKLNQSLLMKI